MLASINSSSYINTLSLCLPTFCNSNITWICFFLQLELFLSSGTVCQSLYSLVAGIFGMNIPYTWNDNHGYVFKWVSQPLQKGRLPSINCGLSNQAVNFVPASQVVLVSGLFCAFMFVSIVAYARHKGLVGS